MVFVLRAKHRPQGTKSKSFTISSAGPKELRSLAIGAGSFGAMAVGAFALGALATGVVAVGFLAVRRLKVREAGIDSLQVDELAVRRLRVAELNVTESLSLPEQAKTQPGELVKKEQRT